MSGSPRRGGGRKAGGDSERPKDPKKAKRSGKTKKRTGSTGPRSAKATKRGPKRKAPRRPDPSDTEDAEVRFVQPYQATKAYLCPGCNGEIPEGMGHMVAVPPDAPDLRRHWHRGCWTNRRSRR